MNKVKFSSIYLLFICCLLILGLLIAIPCKTTPALAEESEEENHEIKTYSQATVDENFDDDCVIVVMDKYISEINKIYKNSFFGSIPLKSIKDLTNINGDIASKEYLNTDNFRQILKIELPEHSKENVIRVIHQLEKINGILRAEPNYYDEPDSTEPASAQGTRYSQQWNLTGNSGIQATWAWDRTTGSYENVRVGVIDSGIANHPDLNANLVPGWDFVNNNAITNDDPTGHGTHVAGIIGATGANVNGVVGVSWHVQLVPLQVVNSDGTISSDKTTAAITWAINHNVDILNFSLHSIEESIALKSAIENFQGLFVCSAGNDGTDNDSFAKYPAVYAYGQTFSKRVISVGSTDNTGTKASDSNYGDTTVSLFAPGVNILSTYLYGSYATLSGTSMATPHVTGTAALMFAFYATKPHNMTRAQMAAKIKSTLIGTVTQRTNNPLTDYCVAGGFLNADYALSYLPFTTQTFSGFGYNGSTYYWNGEVDMTVAKAFTCNLNSDNIMVFKYDTNITFSLKTVSHHNAFSVINGTVKFQLKNSSGEIIQIGGNDTYTSTVTDNLFDIVTLEDNSFTINPLNLNNDTYTLTLKSNFTRATWSQSTTKSFTFIVDKPESCIAEGSLITLADGSQKAVEELTGDENLLVWNMTTGTFDSAPILFIDSDPYAEYEITHLYFSDGTEVKVIYEHAFWDIDLNEYIFLRSDAARYVGHRFNKQTTDSNGNMIWTAACLTDVEVYTEYTTAWSPVTYGHLCYYVNGMLSMPGATEGLINIFEVDAATMAYDAEAFAADIETYGLYTYEEFSENFPVSETVFEAFNGQYLKVAIGKGLITTEELGTLIDKYAEFLQPENGE